MTDPNDRLDALFRRYREVCPDVEPGPDFMPGLWRKIDARRTFAWQLRVYARGLVSVAAALCLAIVAMEMTPRSEVNPVYMETYVEVLDRYNSPEITAYADLSPGQGAPRGF